MALSVGPQTPLGTRGLGLAVDVVVGGWAGMPPNATVAAAGPEVHPPEGCEAETPPVVRTAERGSMIRLDGSAESAVTMFGSGGLSVDDDGGGGGASIAEPDEGGADGDGMGESIVTTASSRTGGMARSTASDAVSGSDNGSACSTSRSKIEVVEADLSTMHQHPLPGEKYATYMPSMTSSRGVGLGLRLPTPTTLLFGLPIPLGLPGRLIPIADVAQPAVGTTGLADPGPLGEPPISGLTVPLERLMGTPAGVEGMAGPGPPSRGAGLAAMTDERAIVGADASEMGGEAAETERE